MNAFNALLDYGVRGVIDLRADREVAADPDASAPVPVAHVPITPPTEWHSMREAYLTQLAASQPAFARAAGLLAAAEEPVVVHCAGGRDRIHPRPRVGRPSLVARVDRNRRVMS